MRVRTVLPLVSLSVHWAGMRSKGTCSRRLVIRPARCRMRRVMARRCSLREEWPPVGWFPYLFALFFATEGVEGELSRIGFIFYNIDLREIAGFKSRRLFGRNRQ